MIETGIVILAAGNSSRMGKPKQLLTFSGKSFIQHIGDEALKAKLSPVVIVIGAYSEQVLQELPEEYAKFIVQNERWREGMSSGIFTGISKILSLKTKVENIIISVCDQPYISAELFQKLIEKKNKSDKNIVACAYSNVLGTPVLFGNSYFDVLLCLKGAEGAKKILNLNATDVASVPFKQGNIDIDTEEDYLNLLRD